MNCIQAQKNLQLYLDGRLDPRRFPLLETHLDSCATCQHDLAMYETLREALMNPGVEREPANLTMLIMARIASAEQQRTARAAHSFAWRWSDALLAAGLGTASTLLFLLIDPALRDAFFSMFTHSFPLVTMLMQAEGPGAIPWVAWIFWIVLGFGLTILLAGAEMRAAWKRTLVQQIQRVPTPPQFRHL